MTDDEPRKHRFRWAVACVAAGVIAIVVAFLPRDKRVDEVPAADAADEQIGQPPVISRSPDVPAIPKSQPASARQLAERALAARTTQPREVAARVQDQGRSPCAALHGSWRFEADELLTLQGAGLATWQPGAAREPEAVRWLCMQDGTAEVQLTGETLRVTGEATADAINVANYRGANVTARRAEP